MDKRIFALGFFDGVHLGHQALLRECCRLAAEQDAVPAAITFDAHPQSLFLATPPLLLSTEADRRMLLQHYGIREIFTLPVTPENMGMPWQVFMERLLEQHAVGFVCGDDFRCGYKGLGDAAAVLGYCRERNLPCTVIQEQSLDGNRISSTLIRGQIEAGDMESATRYLGHPLILTGKVVHEHQLGRKLGFSTVNLELPGTVTVPKFGVYACRAYVDGKPYPAVTNVGTQPTVSGTGTTVELWILDFEGDLYDREIQLEFHDFLRPEMKFPDLESLRQEILRNGEQTRAYLRCKDEEC